MIISTINLKNGDLVRIDSNNSETIQNTNISEFVRYLRLFGEIFVKTDNSPKSEEVLKQICKLSDCNVLINSNPTLEEAKKIISYGAQKIVLKAGTQDNILALLPKNKAAVYIETDMETNLKRYNNYTNLFFVKLANKENTSLEEIRTYTAKNIAIESKFDIPDISRFEKENISVIIDCEYYENKEKMTETFCQCLDFEKRYGYLPTIVQDYETKQVLMLAYSNLDSLKQALNTQKGTYFSRSRKKIWIKGETSGNIQGLVKARYNCDKDAILFFVRQTGNACRHGKYSCFSEKDIEINSLYNDILNKKRLLPDKALTTKLFEDEYVLKKKLMEKAFDLINYEKNSSLETEAAQLTYLLLTFMAAHNITPKDVLNKLSSMLD